MKKHRNFQQGFLNITLASVIAGVMVVVNFISAEIHHVQSTPAPVVQTAAVNQTTTTNVLPASNNTAGAVGAINQPLAIQTPAAAALTVAVTEKACGSDVSCLTASAQTCLPSNGTITKTFDLFGVNETLTTNYEIAGKNSDGTCQYDSTLTAVSLAPDATNKGTTLADLKPSQTALNKTIGTKIQCSVSPAAIIQTITDMSEGNINSSDISATNPACTATDSTGKMVNPATVTPVTGGTFVSPSLVSGYQGSLDGGMKFPYTVSLVTANQISLTITDAATGKSVPTVLTLNTPITLDGYTITITKIQQNLDGSYTATLQASN